MKPGQRQVDGRRIAVDRETLADENRRIVVLTLFSVSIAVLLASQSPEPLFLPMLAVLLSISATATGFVALVMKQPVQSATFTFWDKSAALFFVSLVAHLFADQEAARLYVETLAAAEAATVGETIAIEQR